MCTYERLRTTSQLAEVEKAVSSSKTQSSQQLRYHPGAGQGWLKHLYQCPHLATLTTMWQEEGACKSLQDYIKSVLVPFLHISNHFELGDQRISTVTTVF
eukprot:scpid102849/ scgid27108/ 